MRTARGEFGERAVVLLELRDSDGLSGFGEAEPSPGFGTETVERPLRSWSPPKRCWVPGTGAGRLDPRTRRDPDGAPAARAAVQGALWDLAARRAGRPLAEELAAVAGPLHGEVLRRVPTSALLVAREPAALREEAARARESGYRAAKIKLGAVPLEEDVARTRAAREGLGPAVRLRGDANGAWDLPAARARRSQRSRSSLSITSNSRSRPATSRDSSSCIALRQCVSRRTSRWPRRRARSACSRPRAVDVVVLKPATLGGPERALEIAARARQAGIEVVFSHTFETAVGARHALHCAAAWGDPSAVHGLCTAGLFESDVAAPVECPGGLAEVSDAPGLGITP